MASGYFALKDLSPYSAKQLIHLLAVGLAHLVEEVRLYGALEAVVGTTDDLHFYIKFFKQVLVEHDLRGHAMQVERTFWIQIDLVGNGSHIIGALAVCFGITDDELA